MTSILDLCQILVLAQVLFPFYKFVPYNGWININSTSMLKYIVIAVFALVIIVSGIWYFVSNPSSPAPVPQAAAPIAPQAVTSTYATTTFSVVYPVEYVADENYAYDQFGLAKLIHGVKFTIPGTVATGTNLSSDSYVSVETLPRAKRCSADIYINADVKSQEIVGDTGVTYSLATSSGAAAGSVYEEMVYALPSSSPCIAIRYFLHTTAMDNYEPGTVREFDRSAILAAFDKIRQSLVLIQ